MMASEELMFVAREALRTAGFSVFLEADYAVLGLSKPNNSDFSLMTYKDASRDLVFVEDTSIGAFICTLKSGGPGKIVVDRMYPQAKAPATLDNTVINLADPNSFDHITRCILACR